MKYGVFGKTNKLSKKIKIYNKPSKKKKIR